MLQSVPFRTKEDKQKQKEDKKSIIKKKKNNKIQILFLSITFEL